MSATYQQDAHYLQATTQEQKFFDAYVIDRDIIKAVLSAYRMKDADAARDYGLKILARPRIKNLLDTYFTKPKLPELPTIEDLRHYYIDLYKSDLGTIREKLQALTAYERVSGFNKQKKAAIDPDAFDPLDDLLDEQP